MYADQVESRPSRLVSALVYAYALVLAARNGREQPRQVRERSHARERNYAPGKGGGIGAEHKPRQPQETHECRAEEDGRGRHASSPLEIPWKGWKDILWRVYAEIGEDRVLAIAAGVVFYSLLALFPAVTAGVSIYALFADAGTISDHIAGLSSMLPGGAIDIVSEQITRIVQRGASELTFGFVIGLGVALWSANAGIKAIFDALNVIYDETEKRGFIKLNLISLTFTLAAIALVLVMVASVAVLPIVLGFIGLGGAAELLLRLGRWPMIFVIGVLALSVLYRFGPSREHAQWRWLTVGSAFAAIVWMITSIAFSWYVANFGSYNATYGSLGAAIGMMMWMWLSIIVVLVGAELDSEIEHQTAKDTTTGKPQPLGARGATMADTVGKAQT
jgi:membrane protein